ncbi:hypothetical protein ABZ473_26530 [Streptomyces cellulosae]
MARAFTNAARTCAWSTPQATASVAVDGAARCSALHDAGSVV